MDKRPLCSEPWRNYYILRRGIMPCCHGHEPIASMGEWEAGWNSAELQEIRSYLARGELSPYCLLSLSCPIVQRHLGARPAILASDPLAAGGGVEPVATPKHHPSVLRIANRALGGLPGRVYRRLRRHRP